MPSLRARLDSITTTAGRMVRDRIDEAISGPRMKAQEDFARRVDAVASIVSTMTGMGGEYDKSKQGRPSTSRAASSMTMAELEVLKRYNGTARRYIDQMAVGCTAHGWHIKSGRNRVRGLQAFDRSIGLRSAIREALTNGFVQGRAAILLITDDYATALKDPLEPGANIVGIVTLEREDFSVGQWGYKFNDAKSYGRALTWKVHPQVPMAGSLDEADQRYRAGTFEAHHSRLLYFGGRLVSRNEWQRTNSDDSLLEAVWEALQNLNTVRNAGGVVATELVQKIMTISDLAAMEEGKGFNAVKARIQLIAAGLSVVGITLLGKNEQLQVQNAQPTGYKELAAEARSWFSGDAGLSQTRLFGESPSGFSGGKDDSGEKHDAATFMQYQESHLREPLEWWYALVLAMPDGPDVEVPEDDWHLVFNSTIVLSPLQEATRREIDTRRAVTATTAGVLDAEEVREAHYGSDEWREPQADGDSPIASMSEPSALPSRN